MGDLICDIVSAFLAETLPAFFAAFIPWLLMTTLQVLVWVGLFQLGDGTASATTRGIPAAAHRLGRAFSHARVRV